MPNPLDLRENILLNPLHIFTFLPSFPHGKERNPLYEQTRTRTRTLFIKERFLYGFLNNWTRGITQYLSDIISF